ncbi:outer membrane beta-barrel protein [Kordiimonas marina]|uniref:outer membrane beta-barrel protein n=1 Tax=Kordiimonas marina TaxID=2872312 RepID=UPI001FF68A88|nr:outer membrane beta-barrel protein [Kordiimonas marina]MCJ9429593.1 porin family protein [Kordiimonas marina]
MKAISLAAMAAATLAFAGAAQADDAHPFTGFYLGAEAGLVNDSDYNDLYYAGVLGARKQLDNDLVLGVEGTFGSADIDYLDNIWTVNGTVGYAFGAEKRDMIFVGAGYVKVKASAFGFSATGDGLSTILGYERAIGSNWSFRVKANMYDTSSVTTTLGVAYRF